MTYLYSVTIKRNLIKNKNKNRNKKAKKKIKSLGDVTTSTSNEREPLMIVLF